MTFMGNLALSELRRSGLRGGEGGSVYGRWEEGIEREKGRETVVAV